MNAQVFMLKGQTRSLFRNIKLLLEDEFCRCIDVERIDIDPQYGRNSSDEMHKNCRNYLNFLRASFVVSKPFEIVIKNDQETDWYYLGYSLGMSLYEYCFEMKHMQMTSLFPAVAIKERIVILPDEFLKNAAVHPRAFLSLPKPLNLRGVELIDFKDQETVKHAVSRVAGYFRFEWRSLCQRHMRVHGLLKPNFEELSLLLNVDSLLLESSDLFSPGVRLDVNVEGKAVEDRPSTIVLEIRNDGDKTLKNVRIRVKAPSGALASSFSEMHDLVPPQPVRLVLELTAKAAPVCPLEVFIDLGDEESEVPAFPIPVQVDVLPQDSEQNQRRDRL